MVSLCAVIYSVLEREAAMVAGSDVLQEDILVDDELGHCMAMDPPIASIQPLEAADSPLDSWMIQ